MTKDKNFNDYDALMSVFGGLDSNVKRLEEAFGVKIFADKDGVKISGAENDVNKAAEAMETLTELASKQALSPHQTGMVIDLIKSGRKVGVSELSDSIAITKSGKSVRAMTIGQKRYADAIKRNRVVLGIGPAGTGKTYLAVAFAVTALKNREVDRIILTRPAVEAGEKLGFLPGDLTEKVDPYLRPLYDALQEMMGADSFIRNMERGTIEIAPLAYMRGRTLSNSFIILDEAQNTTKEQMKMFLTRMGENSRVVVNGDVTQIDLPHNVLSGLRHAAVVLKDIDGIEIVKLGYGDVVRDELVAKIVDAYERAAAEEARAREADDAKAREIKND